MIQIHDVEQGTPEWHAIREGKYTGSNAEKLLRYGTIGYSLTTSSDFKGNFYTKRGHILEDEAIELYEAIFGCSVQRPGFITNSRFPDCGYSPDGIDNDTLLEVKCFNELRHRGIYDGDIPLKVLAQIYFGLLITELKQARLVIYNPDLDSKLAFKAVEIKNNRKILSNFQQILNRSKHNDLHALRKM